MNDRVVLVHLIPNPVAVLVHAGKHSHSGNYVSYGEAKTGFLLLHPVLFFSYIVSLAIIRWFWDLLLYFASDFQD